MSSTLNNWDIIFYILIGLTGCLCFSYFLLIVAHFMMPKVLIKTYFKAPYFQKWELNKFNKFPFFFIRTAMFMRLIAQPSSGKKRGMVEAYKLTSRWFRWYCGAVTLFFLASFIPFLLIIFSSGLVLYFQGEFD